MTVHLADVVVRTGTQFDGRHIFQTQHLTAGQRLDDHVFIVHLVFIPSPIFEHILEGILSLGTQGTRGRLDVLLVEHTGNVGRHKAIFLHLTGIEPDAHGILIAKHIHLTHTGNTRKTRLDIDFHVVGQESPVERVVGAVHGQLLDVTSLTLAHIHTAAGYLGR